MVHVTPHNETVHKELISKIDDLLDFCRLNGYSHLVLIGDDREFSQYMEGTYETIGGMVSTFAVRNESFKKIVKHSNEVIKGK